MQSSSSSCCQRNCRYFPGDAASRGTSISLASRFILCGVLPQPTAPCSAQRCLSAAHLWFLLPSFPALISCYMFLPEHLCSVSAPCSEIKDQLDLYSCTGLVLRVQFPFMGQKHMTRKSGKLNVCSTADQQVCRRAGRAWAVPVPQILLPQASPLYGACCITVGGLQ